MSIVNLIVSYLRQPSTWAGASILVAMGAMAGISAEGVELIGSAVIALIAVVEFFRNEKKTN